MHRSGKIHGFSVKEVPIHSPPNSDNGIPKFHIDPKLPDNTHSLMMNNTYLIAGVYKASNPKSCGIWSWNVYERKEKWFSDLMNCSSVQKLFVYNQTLYIVYWRFGEKGFLRLMKTDMDNTATSSNRWQDMGRMVGNMRHPLFTNNGIYYQSSHDGNCTLFRVTDRNITTITNWKLTSEYYGMGCPSNVWFLSNGSVYYSRPPPFKVSDDERSPHEYHVYRINPCTSMKGDLAWVWKNNVVTVWSGLLDMPSGNNINGDGVVLFHGDDAQFYFSKYGGSIQPTNIFHSNGAQHELNADMFFPSMFTNETVFISHGYSPIKTTVTRNHHKSIITGIKTVDFINSSGRTRSLHRGMNYYVYLLPYSNSTVIRGINGSDHTTNRVDNFSIPGSKGTDKVRNLCAVGEMSNDEKRYPSMREKCNDVPTPPAPVPSPPSPPPPPSPALPPGEAFFFHFNYSYQHDEYNASFWQIHGFSVKEVPIHSPPNSDNGIPKFHIDPKLPDNTHSLMMNNTYLIAGVYKASNPKSCGIWSWNVYERKEKWFSDLMNCSSVQKLFVYNQTLYIVYWRFGEKGFLRLMKTDMDNTATSSNRWQDMGRMVGNMRHPLFTNNGIYYQSSHDGNCTLFRVTDRNITTITNWKLTSEYYGMGCPSNVWFLSNGSVYYSRPPPFKVSDDERSPHEYHVYRINPCTSMKGDLAWVWKNNVVTVWSGLLDMPSGNNINGDGVVLFHGDDAQFYFSKYGGSIQPTNIFHSNGAQHELNADMFFPSMFTNETVFISHGYSPIKTTVTRNHHKSIITGIKTVDFINSSGRTRSLHRGMNYYVYLLPYSNSTVIRGINGSDHTTNRVDNFSIPGSKGTDKVRNLCAVGEMSNDEKRYPSMREKCNDVPTPPAPVPSPPSPPPPPSPALPPGEAFFFHFNYSYQHDEYNASFWQIHGFSVKEVPIHSPPNSDNGIPKFHIDPKLPDNTHSLMMNNTYLIAGVYKASNPKSCGIWSWNVYERKESGFPIL